MRTPPASPDLQSPPSNPAQGTGPGHVNRGGSDNRDRGAKAGVTHHCGVVKEHAATADEEPSLKKPPETVRRNSDFAIPIDVGCVSGRGIEPRRKPFRTTRLELLASHPRLKILRINQPTSLELSLKTTQFLSLQRLINHVRMTLRDCRRLRWP